MAKNIRCRYAPSPTGYFHIGGARTALMNYLFAKHNGGSFIVRIEDTDIERNVADGIESQLTGLAWLGIFPDESPKNVGDFGPYIQSEKFDKYKELAEKLITEGKAYYCFCTPEELEAARENALAQGLTPKYNRKCLNLSRKEIEEKLNSNVSKVIRLKMPDNTTFEWKDLVRGNMRVPSDALTDPVILKSNGIPMYNFAVVIDDHDMKITHVLRGEEHISNTPYQIAIKNALGYNDDIQYGHLSIIVDETGKKLSKRNLDLKQFIEDYKALGYIPEAVVNFLALLGWSPNSTQEIMSVEEIIKNFSSERISKAPAFFDIKKMNWLSSSYIKKMSEQDYLKQVKEFVNIDTSPLEDKLNDALLIFKNQLNYLSEINSLVVNTFLSTNFENLPVEISNSLTSDNFLLNIKALKNELESINEITLENAGSVVENVKIKTGLKGKDLYMPIRVAAIAKEHGPEMNKILYIVGKQKILNNINYLLE